MQKKLLNKLPFEIINKIYYMCLPSIFCNNNLLKNDIINNSETFFNIKIRIFYIKKYEKFLIKKRIKNKILKLTKNNTKK